MTLGLFLSNSTSYWPETKLSLISFNLRLRLCMYRTEEIYKLHSFNISIVELEDHLFTPQKRFQDTYKDWFIAAISQNPSIHLCRSLHYFYTRKST